MAKPINKNMNEIALKYQTGQYGVNKLAKMYNVDKATISRYLKKHNIEINQHAKSAIESLNKGYQEISNLMDSQDKSTLNQQIDSKDLKNGTILQDKSYELVDEVIEIVKANNPKFAKGFQSLSALMIKRASEILQGEDVTSGDISNISRAVANMNDTLGVFPKIPTIAQQINIGNKSENKKQVNQDIKLEIEFK